MSSNKNLPQIKNIQWVNASDFVDKKLEIGEEVEYANSTRVQLMYKYPDGKGQFSLSCIKEEEAFFRTNGVEEDSYIVPKTGVRTKLGRNIVKLYLDKDNQYHQEFYEVLTRVRNIVKKKLDKENGRKNNVQIKGLYNLVNDDKDITGYVVTARLIEGRDGSIFSSAYDDVDQLDITQVGRSRVRPAIIFSYVIPEDKKDEYRISMSVSQMYVKQGFSFPLRDRD